MRPPEGVGNTLAAAKVQDVETQVPEPVIRFYQNRIGMGTVELRREGERDRGGEKEGVRKYPHN